MLFTLGAILVIGRLFVARSSSTMELSIISGVAVVVALIWLAARTKSQRPQRRSDRPRIWDSTPGTESVPWFGLWRGSDSGASHHGSGHSHHDGGQHSSTNTPSDGGHFGGGFGGGGGGDGGGGDGGGGH